MPGDEREQVRELYRLLKNGEASLVGPNGVRHPIPAHVYEALKRATELMLKGQAVSITPVNQRLTTKAAADFLGVSRPFLVGLLTSGKIPFEMVGTHRRVKLVDLIHYQAERAGKQRQALKAMADFSAENGLYEEPFLPEDAELD